MNKTCFCLTALDAGGTERYLLRFLEFSKTNIEATVICKSGKLGSLEPFFKETQANIIQLKMGYFNISSWIKMYSLLKKSNFNSVVDLTGNFGGVIMMISYFASVEKRITFYRYSSNQFNESLFKLWYNNFVKFLVLKFSTKILSNSKTAFKFFFPKTFVNNEKFRVIFNGVSAHNFEIEESKNSIRESLGLDSDIFLIGHIGRNDSSKNHKTIFQVAKILIENDKNVHFLFCGKDTDNMEFKNKIKNLAIEKNVHLLGERLDAPRILKSLDVFYFPSVTEGQPNALIEAMLSHLPIVTSNIEPIKEIIPNEMHDRLISPINILETIKQLELIQKDPKSQKDFNLYQWACKNFNSEINLEKFKEEL